MAVEIFDVSVPVRPGMVTYPGDPEVRLVRVKSMGAGDSYNLSRLDLGLHSGTHVDAPLHFIDGGADVPSMPLDVLIGPAVVVDALAVEAKLDARALEGLDLPTGAERVLFKTTNSELWARDAFAESFVALAEDGARALVERHLRLVGIDYLSIGDEAVHQVLLGAGMVVIESLDLRRVEPGEYQLVCAPVRIAGAEGAPARTLLLR